MGGDHDSPDHPIDEAATDVVEDLGAQVEDAIDDAVEAAKHSPEGVASLSHDLHQELEALHLKHADLERRHAEAEAAHAAAHDSIRGELASGLDQLGRRVDEVIATPPAVADTAAEEALDIPEEVVKPRKRHFMHRVPRWL